MMIWTVRCITRHTAIIKIVDIEPTAKPRKLRTSWAPNTEHEYDILDRMRKREKEFEMSKKFRYIGYWYCSEMKEAPNPLDFVDTSFDETDRARLVEYLEDGHDHEHWKGFSGCRICDKTMNGTKDLTDGEYVWTEGFAHYVKEHNVLPPPAFIRKVLWETMLKNSVK